MSQFTSQRPGPEPVPPQPPPPPSRSIRGSGFLLERLEEVGHLAWFSFRATLALPSGLLRPGNVFTQLYGVLFGSLPLGLTAGVAIGVVIWMHLRGALLMVGGVGALKYLPQALALAVVLEFSPLAAGLILAGRSGASLGAELGAMRLTEQVDALEVLGLSPLRELVAPRVLACLLGLPVLTLFLTWLALLAGYGAEVLGGTLSWTEYQTECLRVLRLRDVIPATLKTMVFGYLIGLVGCYFGLHAQGGTEGVGRAATRSVVLSIFAVLVADVVLVKVIQLLV